jgi:hypothetical protein
LGHQSRFILPRECGTGHLFPSVMFLAPLVFCIAYASARENASASLAQTLEPGLSVVN